MKQNNSEKMNGVESITSMFDGDSEDVFVMPRQERTITVDQPMNVFERVRHLKYNAITIGSAALVSALGIGVVAGIHYGADFKAAIGPNVENETSIEKGAKAEIQSVDMDIQPIVLSTAETKVTGVKAQFQNKVSAMGGLVNFSVNKTSVTREASVETNITIDPSSVALSYDSEKEKLTIGADNSTLTTEVDIPTAASKTVDTTGSFTAMPGQVLSAMSNALAGSFGGGANEVPILGGIAKGTTDVKTGLEHYADLYIVTQVDEQCTPLIPKKVPNFTEELKKNIRESVKGQLLNPDVTNSDANASLSLLMDKPLGEVQKIVSDAEVTMPDDYTIGADKKNIDQLKKYEKTEFFSSNTSGAAPMECGVSKDVKLTRSDEGGAQ